MKTVKEVEHQGYENNEQDQRQRRVASALAGGDATEGDGGNRHGH